MTDDLDSRPELYGFDLQALERCPELAGKSARCIAECIPNKLLPWFDSQGFVYFKV